MFKVLITLHFVGTRYTPSKARCKENKRNEHFDALKPALCFLKSYPFFGLTLVPTYMNDSGTTEIQDSRSDFHTDFISDLHVPILSIFIVYRGAFRYMTYEIFLGIGPNKFA